MRADYEEGFKYVELFLEDIQKYDLEFALPYANWTIGLLALGLRRFGQAERAIQAVEDGAPEGQEQGHDINIRALRARLLLQLGHVDEAWQHVSRDVFPRRIIPSWVAEYLATRALSLACMGKVKEAEVAAEQALARSRIAEVRQLAGCAIAVGGALTGDPEPARLLMRTSTDLGIWDPFVCAVRSSSALAELVATFESERPTLEALYRKSHDRALARAAGFRTRETRSPHEVLSPREMEVLGLIARGFRNREISKALFIADSTTKVHVRHILEKLGVRTRAQAVARYEMFADTRYGSGASEASGSSDASAPPKTNSGPRPRR
jgi:ATP/maltotriose-dependent transcriptional regulator MalT